MAVRKSVNEYLKSKTAMYNDFFSSFVSMKRREKNLKASFTSLAVHLLLHHKSTRLIELSKRT